MHSHVDFEAASPRVAPVTNDANEGSLPRVGEHVRLQVALGDEPILAVSAGKGALACMGAHVGLEVASLTELLQTAKIGAQ